MGTLKIEDLPRYTYDDYKTWQGDWELIDGIAYAMTPAPMIKHQSLAYKIASEFEKQIENCAFCEVLGEVDYKINDDTVLRPDVVLICDEPNDAYLTKAPEIIVEVISKSTAKIDENQKFNLYESEAVKYYILIYPDELIAKIYKWVDGRYIKQGDFHKESFSFDNISCKVELDFERVFKRYK